MVQTIGEKSSAASIIISEEKVIDGASSTLNLQDGDEALQLVGIERSVAFSEEYNRKLRRKLDFIIPPIAAAVYFMQYLDKSSLNYASITGLPITGQDYNLLSMSFYIGYMVWEFPTLYISQKTRLGKYLGANLILWGALLAIQSVVKSFGAFFALRFLLGMLESCVGPILILIISMFYKKDEQARRISWFFNMNGMAQFIGGFLAYGVSFADSKRLATYKIIFIFLGLLACFVGVCVMLFLPDSPVRAHMLTKEERIAALERVRNDQGGTENHTFKKDQVVEALLDPRTWLIVLTTLLIGIPNGALGNFSNIIIKSFGYTARQTLILSTPSGLIAALTTLACGFYSDKKNERMLPIVFCVIPTIIGSAILVGLNNKGHKGALLFGTFLIGTFQSALSSVYSYNASNISGHTKKVTVNAITMVFFSVGNIVGTEIFQAKDAPAYIAGKTAIMILLVVQIFVALTLRTINQNLNRRKRMALAAEKEHRGWSEADVEKERERHAFADLTDRQNKFFLYTS